jgi:type IV pilus assembly protein PilE
MHATTQLHKHFQRQGFTLIESVLSMALMAILMGIALPNLERQWQHARRQDAHHALTQLHLRQLQWRGLHAQYASTLSELSWPNASSSAGHYALLVQNANAQSFNLQATAIGLQARDAPCLIISLRLTADGVVQRTSNLQNADPGRCWPW